MKTKETLVVVLLASAVALTARDVRAADLYVTTTGTDAGLCPIGSPCLTIGFAIGAASGGDKIHVGPGTYAANLTFPADIFLQSTSGAPTTTIGGTGGCAVTISGDGVTIDGFTVTNPTGSGAICSTNNSTIAIRNNIVTNVGSVAGATNVHAVVIVSSSAAVSDITIEDNQISNIRVGPNKSDSAITIGFSTGALDVTNLIIQRNVISDVKANTSAWPVGHGAYGILINHGTGITGKTVGAQVLNNTITDLEGLWAHGIGLEGNTPNAVVQGNIISSLVDHKAPSDAVAVQVEDNASAATVAINSNCFSNVNVGVQNVTGIGVDAEDNWWGAVSGPSSVGFGGGVGVTIDVDFDPWWCTCGGTSTCGDGVCCGLLGEDNCSCAEDCGSPIDCADPASGSECGSGVRGGGALCNAVPAVSEWGLLVMVLLGLATGTILYGRRRFARN